MMLPLELCQRMGARTNAPTMCDFERVKDWYLGRRSKLKSNHGGLIRNRTYFSPFTKDSRG